MFLADSFASTPAGVVTGVGVPVLFGLMLTIWTRGARRIGKIEDTLSASTQALAILIDRDTSDRPLMGEQSTRITKLEQATAVLLDRLDRHEAWANAENSHLRGNSPP